MRSAQQSRHPCEWHRKRGYPPISDYEIAQHGVRLRHDNLSKLEIKCKIIEMLCGLEGNRLLNLRAVYHLLWTGDTQPMPDYYVWDICEECFGERVVDCVCEQVIPEAEPKVPVISKPARQTEDGYLESLIE